MICLQTLRKARGMTQSELARLSGVTQATISEIETSKNTNPSIQTVAALCDSLDCTLEEMIGRQTEGNG